MDSKIEVTMDGEIEVRTDYAHGVSKRYLNGKLHGGDQPAIGRADGSYVWARNGKAHNEHGIAILHADGTCEWMIDGKHHRVGGPAIDRPDGTCAYYTHGKKDRADGPAVITLTGGEWWTDGVFVRAEKTICGPTEFGWESRLGGKLHRIGEAALFHPAYRNPHKCSSNEWYRDGLRHRIGAPAIEYENGDYECYVDGELHCDDGPALLYHHERDKYFRVTSYGETKWAVHGKYHRVDGPAIIVGTSNGNCETWYVDGLGHREDGPSYRNGTGSVQEWRIRGKFHRIGGPADIDHSGEDHHYDAWYTNGQMDREDGPAYHYYGDDHRKAYDLYYLDGKEYKTKSAFESALVMRKINASMKLAPSLLGMLDGFLMQHVAELCVC